MNKYWLVAFLIWCIALIIAGWEGRSWYDKAAQDKADQAIIAEQQKNAQLLGQISASYEAGKQSVLATQLSSTIALSKPNAKYSTCTVLSDDRKLLINAVNSANTATR